MATLTIRNLPDEVHERLKGQAKRNRRSLNQEVIAELSAEGASKSDEIRAAAAKERWVQANVLVNELRSKVTTFMTSEEIDAAIKEGRR